jgi:hypothetical protein
MTALPAVMPLTIGKTILRPASDQAGKVVASASVLTENRLDWRDIATTAICQDHIEFSGPNAARLTLGPSFLQSRAPSRGQPNPKQLDGFESITSKLRDEVGGGNDQR